VLERLAAPADWQPGRGLALTESHGSLCGQVVGLDSSEDGLAAALYGEITLAGGRVQQGNFDRYRLLRLAGPAASANPGCRRSRRR